MSEAYNNRPYWKGVIRKVNIGFLNPLDSSKAIIAKDILIIQTEDIHTKTGHEKVLTLQKPLPILEKNPQY